MYRLKTSKADNLRVDNRHLQFDVDRPCIVYICWDLRSKLIPKWVAKFGYLKSGLLLQTSTTTHAVFYRTFKSSFRIVLGGPGMKQSGFDNYIVLLGDIMYHNPVQGVSWHWRLKPSSEISQDDDEFISGSKCLNNVEDVSIINSKTSNFISFSLKFRELQYTILDRRTLSPQLTAHIGSILIDAGAFIDSSKNIVVISRVDGVELSMSAVVSLIMETDDVPVYILEPGTIRILWQKVAGDLHHDLEMSCIEFISLNISTASLTKMLSCYDVFVSVFHGFYLETTPHHDFTMQKSETLSREQTSMVIYNSLGVDIRLWISGAGFLEASSSYSNTFVYGQTAQADDCNSEPYSQQSFLLPGESVSVVFSDPLACNGSEDPCSYDFIEDVIIDCEIDGWSDIEFRLLREGTALYQIFPQDKSLNMSSSSIVRDWASLSNCSISDAAVSPMLRWKHKRAPDLLLGSPERANESINPVFPIINEAKAKESPYAIKISGSIVSSSSLRGKCSVEVILSSNIIFKNCSGAKLDMLSRDHVEFDDNVTQLENNSCWEVPLTVIKEGIFRLHSHSPSINIEIPIYKELLDIQIPQWLRRSNETDFQSISIHPDPSSPLETAESLSSWVIMLSPAITVCNATMCTFDIQFKQPSLRKSFSNVVNRKFMFPSYY
jgi:hypothetical protein